MSIEISLRNIRSQVRTPSSCTCQFIFFSFEIRAKKNQKYPFFIIILSNESQLFRLINHTTLMLRKHQEKQLSFYVLNLLVDYARTMQHKRILHSGSNHEVDQLILSNTPCYLISFRFSSLVFMTFFFSCE